MRVKITYGSGEHQQEYEFDSGQIRIPYNQEPDMRELMAHLRDYPRIIVQGPHQGEYTFHNLAVATTVRITT